jgi:hypothetical protein
MEHSNKQVFLFGIGEEFDEHTAAVVAAECKTGDPVFITCFIVLLQLLSG